MFLEDKKYVDNNGLTKSLWRFYRRYFDKLAQKTQKEQFEKL
tara:strand:- start:101 stop:226 length:126 start_codon:yes stop_codon:yes gene_type:complete